MAARNFLKKAVYWPAVFLCILSIGSASVSLGDQPAGAIHSGYVETIGLDTTDFPRGSLSDPSTALPEEVGSLTPAQSLRPTPPSVTFYFRQFAMLTVPEGK